MHTVTRKAVLARRVLVDFQATEHSTHLHGRRADFVLHTTLQRGKVLRPELLDAVIECPSCVHNVITAAATA